MEPFAFEAEFERYLNGLKETAVELTAPLLVTDGDACSKFCMENRAVSVAYRDVRYRISAMEADVSMRRLGVRAPNRNGIYDLAVFERAGGTISARFEFSAM